MTVIPLSGSCIRRWSGPKWAMLLKKSLLRELMRGSRNHASSMAEKAECYCVIYPHQDREFRESSADRLFQQYWALRVIRASHVWERPACSIPRTTISRARPPAPFRLAPAKKATPRSRDALQASDRGQRAAACQMVGRNRSRRGVEMGAQNRTRRCERGPVCGLHGCHVVATPAGGSDRWAISRCKIWRTRRDSNSRPLPSEGSALSS